jgi:hypothetical protein
MSADLNFSAIACKKRVLPLALPPLIPMIYGFGADIGAIMVNLFQSAIL